MPRCQPPTPAGRWQWPDKPLHRNPTNDLPLSEPTPLPARRSAAADRSARRHARDAAGTVSRSASRSTSSTCIGRTFDAIGCLLGRLFSDPNTYRAAKARGPFVCARPAPAQRRARPIARGAVPELSDRGSSATALPGQYRLLAQPADGHLSGEGPTLVRPNQDRGLRMPLYRSRSSATACKALHSSD
jgi:hypothetical protein